MSGSESHTGEDSTESEATSYLPESRHTPPALRIAQPRFLSVGVLEKREYIGSHRPPVRALLANLRRSPPLERPRTFG